MTTTRLDRIVFVGGGTGGTVGPGVAIAERLHGLQPGLDLHFLVSDRPVDRRMLEPDGWGFTPTPARSPSLNPRRAVGFARGWFGTRRVARAVLGGSSRTRLVALGGFVAPPAVSVARTLGVPVDLVNLDAVAGRANRWIAARASRVVTSVDTDLSVRESPMGVPLRRSVLAEAPASEARERLGLRPDLSTLLVTGASQGARSIDRFMIDLVAEEPDLLEGWQVLHLAGGDLESVREAYVAGGVSAVVLPFLERMGWAWSAADLAISRGGASSVAEVAASRTPAIFLPYPWHKDRHQARNAAFLRDAGAAEVLDDPGEREAAAFRVREVLGGLLGDATRLARMRAAFPEDPGDAATRLAEYLLDA